MVQLLWNESSNKKKQIKGRIHCSSKNFLFVFLIAAFFCSSPAVLFLFYNYRGDNNKNVVHDAPSPSVNHLSSSSNTKKKSGGVFTQAEEKETRRLEDDYKVLPQWMKDYFVWHAKQRSEMIVENDGSAHAGTNYKRHRFLILRCIQSDYKCGGLSDRIKALPLLIWLAAKHNRIFMIYWNRPCEIEEFWLPPSSSAGGVIATGGLLDWRAPEWFKPVIARGEGLYLRNLDRILETVPGDESLLCVKLQDQHGGSEYYNRQHEGGVGNRAHRKVYGPLFRTLFEPSPGLEAALLAERELYPALNQPGGYDAVHLRALYVPPLPTEIVPAVTVNAINCASQFRSSPGTIFFASDSVQASGAAKEYGEQLNKNHSHRHRREVIVIDRWGRKGGEGANPLHLDKASSRDPRDYYDVFLDLYHLSNAECISHGQGGFGRLGSLLSHNASCFFAFFKNSQILRCQGMD